MNKQPSFLFPIFLLLALLAACTGSAAPTPRPSDDDDDGGARNGRYDLTTSEGIHEAYEAITRDRVDEGEYCFKPVRDLNDVAIVGTFAYDYGCMFEEAIVVDEVGSVSEMTQPALLHNGWDDPANREGLAQIWAEDGLMAEFSVIRRENEDFLKPGALPYSTPTVTTRDSGDVEVTMWVQEPAGMLPENSYRHMQIVISAEGELESYERGAQFTVEIGPAIEITPEPTATPEVEVGATATPDTIVEVEATKIPEPTATLVPIATGLQQDQPWIVMANFNGIFAANGDGTAITQLSDDLVAYGQNSLLAEISPDGQWLAYVTAVAEEPILKLIELRSQTERTITPLISDISVPPDAPLDCLGVDGDSDPCQAYYTVGPMAWSPNGSQLAFIGAYDGPTSDLYIYDLADDQVRQLTDGPAHAANPIWSPDGQYIFHQGILFSFGSGVAKVTAAWSARADGGGVVTLHDDPESSWETILGWQGDHTILIHSEEFPCAKNLRAINVATGETISLWPHTFGGEYIAYAPTSETILFSDGSVAGCGDEDFENDGVFFISPIDGSFSPVTAVSPLHISPLHWDPSLSAFYYETLDSWLLIFPEDGGKVFGPEDVTLPPEISLNSYSWGIYAWHDRASEPEGLWLYDRNNPNVGVQLIVEGEVRKVQMVPDTTTLLFFDAESPANLYVADAPDFVPTAVTNGELRGQHWDTLLFWSPVPTN